MCIIVDTNTLANVFDKKSANHKEFKPVLDWVVDGKGVFVYGGSKYIREIGRKYLNFIGELRKVRKALKIDQSAVDAKEIWAAQQVQHPDFDDQHLVGLLLVSGCKLICSLDSRAYAYFTHNSFFPRASKKPKIYSRKNNSVLLINANMADICRPGYKLTVTQKQTLKAG